MNEGMRRKSGVSAGMRRIRLTNGGLRAGVAGGVGASASESARASASAGTKTTQHLSESVHVNVTLNRDSSSFSWCSFSGSFFFFCDFSLVYLTMFCCSVILN